MRIIILVVGVLLIAVGVGKYVSGVDTYNWQRTAGVITYSTVTQKGYSDSKATHKYVPVIKYTYEVDGLKYEGNRITLEDPSYSHPDPAIDVIKEYFVDRAVTVYYDPNYINRSVLKKGVPYIAIVIYAVLGVSLLFIGIFSNYLVRIIYTVPFGPFSVLHNRKKMKRKRIYK